DSAARSPPPEFRRKVWAKLTRIDRRGNCGRAPARVPTCNDRHRSKIQTADNRQVLRAFKWHRLQSVFSSQTKVYATWLLSKSLPIFDRGEECFDHLGVDVVAVELVQLVQPEVVAVPVSIRRIVGIALEVSEVLHQHKGAIEFLVSEHLIVGHQTQGTGTRSVIGGRSLHLAECRRAIVPRSRSQASTQVELIDELLCRQAGRIFVYELRSRYKRGKVIDRIRFQSLLPITLIDDYAVADLRRVCKELSARQRHRRILQIPVSRFVGSIDFVTRLLEFDRQEERGRNIDALDLDALRVAATRADLILPESVTIRVGFAIQEIAVLLANIKRRRIDRIRDRRSSGIDCDVRRCGRITARSYSNSNYDGQISSVNR